MKQEHKKAVSFTCKRCGKVRETHNKRSYQLKLCGGCFTEIKISHGRLGYWVELLDRNRSAWRISEKSARRLANQWVYEQEDNVSGKLIVVINNAEGE